MSGETILAPSRDHRPNITAFESGRQSPNIQFSTVRGADFQAGSLSSDYTCFAGWGGLRRFSIQSKTGSAISVKSRALASRKRTPVDWLASVVEAVDRGYGRNALAGSEN